MSDTDFDKQLKRLLPDPVLRIELYDFVHGVVNEVATKLESEAFSPSTPEPNAESIRERVALYDDIIREPSRMLVVGCLYSDVSSHQGLWTAAIERFASIAAEVDRRSGSKFTAWTQLHWYPALAAMYSCALGSLAGGHPETLAAALAQLREIRAESWAESHLQRIGLDAVGLAGGQLYGDAKTPQAEFMLDRLRSFSAGVVREDGLEDLYDSIEYTIGLVRADQTLGTDLSGHVLPDFVRMLWRRDVRFDKSGSLGGLGRCVEGVNARTWLNAGLFSSDPDRLREVRERYEAALKEYAHRMPF